MTTDQNVSSGNNSDVGDNQNEGQNGNRKEDMVSYETHRKLLGEKKRLQDEAQALKAKLEEKLKAEQEQQEKEMKDKEEWKKLVEIRDKELTETKSKLTEYQQGIRNSKKASAFLGELAKRNISVRSSYYDLIDVDQIAVDPSTEEIDLSSVKKYADAWVTDHFELAKATSSSSKLPNNAPQGNGSQLTYDEWLKLPPSEMKKRYKEMRNSDKAN
jgi:hypothetical protein